MENQFINNKNDILKILKSFSFIDEAYLFGSYAYGKPHQESDIDLCVVVKNGYDTGENFEKINFALFSFLCNRGVAHDLIMLDQKTKEDKKNDKKYVYYPIFHQGKKII